MKEDYKLVDVYELKIKEKIYFKAIIYDKVNHICIDVFIDEDNYDLLTNEYINTYIDDYIKFRYNHKEKKYQIYISAI